MAYNILLEEVDGSPNFDIVEGLYIRSFNEMLNPHLG